MRFADKQGGYFFQVTPALFLPAFAIYPMFVLADCVADYHSTGWDYYVQGEGVMRIPPKNYSENYVYRPNTLRIARTK